jgi:hypothetical protein
VKCSQAIADGRDAADRAQPYDQREVALDPAQLLEPVGDALRRGRRCAPIGLNRSAGSLSRLGRAPPLRGRRRAGEARPMRPPGLRGHTIP